MYISLSSINYVKNVGFFLVTIEIQASIHQWCLIKHLLKAIFEVERLVLPGNLKHSMRFSIFGDLRFQNTMLSTNILIPPLMAK